MKYHEFVKILNDDIMKAIQNYRITEASRTSGNIMDQQEHHELVEASNNNRNIMEAIQNNKSIIESQKYHILIALWADRSITDWQEHPRLVKAL